jgi:hypothetical protein
MADRSAPDGGYNFLEKNIYRRQIWNLARRSGQTVRGDVLLMPSIEGFEIGTAAAVGVPMHRMHIVDRNPAIVATLKRTYPDVHTYGVDVGRACERIAQAGVRLTFANLDFCSNVPNLKDELARITSAGCWDPLSLLVVTMLRGRESAQAIRGIDRIARRLEDPGSLLHHYIRSVNTGRGEILTPRDKARLVVTKMCLMNERIWANPTRAGVYKSPESGQTLLWCAFQRTEHARAASMCLEFLNLVMHVIGYEHINLEGEWRAFDQVYRSRVAAAERLGNRAAALVSR